MADRSDMFGITNGPTRGPTLVAMATTFGLGAESSRLPACLSVCLYVRMSVCLTVTANFKSTLLFLFLDGIEPFFDRQFTMTPLYKTLFFDFLFRPPNAQNLLPKVSCDNATLRRRQPWLRTQQFEAPAYRESRQSTELRGRPLLPWQRHLG